MSRYVVPVLVVVLALTGCAADGSEPEAPPAVEQSPTAEQESDASSPEGGEATEEELSTEGPDELPAEGTDEPPGEAAASLEMTAPPGQEDTTPFVMLEYFEEAFWRSYVAGEPDQDLDLAASPEVVAFVADMVELTASDGIRFGGTFRIEVTSLEGDSNVARAVMCKDWSDVVVTRGEETYSADQVDGLQSRLAAEALLERGPHGPPVVTQYRAEGEC